MKVLGIIPARGGSKGVPGKNIKLLHALPLIGYSIRAAEGSQLTRTIVSSDSLEIIETARKLGGDVPFIRPTELAADDTPTMPVLLHALAMLSEEYDAVMVLQPTSPLRQSWHIDEAIAMLEKDASADSVISVVKVLDAHPARMKRMENGVLIDPTFVEAVEGMRRQDLPEYYLRNGAIYLTRTQVIRQSQSLKGMKCLGYTMSEQFSVNIDSHLDFLLAEAILANGING